MERAVVHSNLKRDEIHPKELLEHYLQLLISDIEQLLPNDSMQDVNCPISGEKEIKHSFNKMGMQYQVSKTHGNIYISPRPSSDLIQSFCLSSSARKFWLNNIWSKTKEIRKKKIILPQLEWSLGFITQYITNDKPHIAEFLPIHWGYWESSKDILRDSKYQLIEPMFDPVDIEDMLLPKNLNELKNNELDIAFLFEALDRFPDPVEILTKVSDSLKSGGLCFITCLLSSGFEVQILGKNSGVFIPPERMNILSFEGMHSLINKIGVFDILEFSTPGVLDIPNVVTGLDQSIDKGFFNYILKDRKDTRMIESFQSFLQMNCLGTFGRIVLQKK